MMKVKDFAVGCAESFKTLPVDFFRKVASINKKNEGYKAESWSADLPEIEALAEREWNDYLTTRALENIKPHFSEKSIEIFLKLTAGEES